MASINKIDIGTLQSYDSGDNYTKIEVSVVSRIYHCCGDLPFQLVFIQTSTLEVNMVQPRAEIFDVKARVSRHYYGNIVLSAIEQTAG